MQLLSISSDILGDLGDLLISKLVMLYFKCSYSNFMIIHCPGPNIAKTRSNIINPSFPSRDFVLLPHLYWSWTKVYKLDGKGEYSPQCCGYVSKSFPGPGPRIIIHVMRWEWMVPTMLWKCLYPNMRFSKILSCTALPWCLFLEYPHTDP